MVKGVILTQVMTGRTNLGYDIASQSFRGYLNAANEAFGHANDLIAHDQHFLRADHAHIHITHIMNEVYAGQPLG